jgi:hypothetical protein
VVCWFGLAGVVVTELLLPDTTGLDLREQERYWSYVTAGREHDYHGVAVHPRHLSRWERWVNKRHHAYNPVKDREARIAELRATYETIEREKAMEHASEWESTVDADEASFISEDVASYFQNEKSNSVATLHSGKQHARLGKTA